MGKRMMAKLAIAVAVGFAIFYVLRLMRVL